MAKTRENTQKNIIIKGAKLHNLKNISLSIPKNKMVVISGVSGSGKSTLAFDTLFAEGQRRYIESLSSYARQFLGKLQKPDVDEIKGICPAIAIEQKVISKNPRSIERAIFQPLMPSGASGMTRSSRSEQISWGWAPDMTFCISAASPTVRAIGP